MIWLLGAGPGDSGLLTVRGFEVLKRADVVIYDRLVGDGILALIPEHAEKIDAGKTSGSHKLSQTEIENLIIEKAKSGKNIVRLKGGDPFLFGRGGEEAEALIKADLNFEIIPGVSSAIAVPEWAGIPVTHRNFCSGINIFTAHDKNNLLPDFNYCSNTVSIFLMGVGNAEKLQEKLLKSLSPETPCAIIEKGTTSLQRVIRTKLENLYDSAKKLNPPAIIIVGKTANLNLNRREFLPLNRKRIIITRPSGRSEALAILLRDAGAEVILMPTIKTSVIDDALNGKKISGYEWVAFTSVTGVEALFELLAKNNRDIREIGNAKIAAIGSATADALKQHGLKVDYVPEVFDGENLAKGLSEFKENFNEKILMFRALNGTPEISKIFYDNNINFTEIYLYRTDYVKISHVPESADIIIFTSASTVRGFAENIKNMRDVQTVCIGRQTAEEAENFGFTKIKTAERATTASIFESIMKHV